ncbi:hypothetical protein BCR43DRAFT_487766 [Syncephalastrum racemosum]|uniref:Uncharacterized protein n=1 Tax=Syncephalastrum racemosum TaxID=13706 RepID=A0A1X2HHJ1_SYNRA|nr:hypothetical protein BCR43DRAFT_487766 [Syncephalastrum racemosum]
MVRLVGLAAAAIGFVSSCAYAAKVQVSQDGQFNITSPLDNSIYVAGQILPITYRLGDATLSSFGLNIYLKSSTVANFSEVAIATGADVSKSSAQTEDGSTFYQHTINYAIPSVDAAGSYQVMKTRETRGGERGSIREERKLVYTNR